MVRLNLQLFAYTGNSIVDYLKSTGQDSSFSARKKLAENNGISNYTGTASQNTQLLNALRSGSSNTSTTNTTTTTNSNNAASSSTTTIPEGANQSTYDKVTEEFKTSDNTNKLQSTANDYADKYYELANKENIVDQKYWDAINKEFVVPEAVTQADAFLSGQLEKIQSGKTSYTDQINDLMNKYMNREEFEYDVDNDVLFQQALASAMNSGKSAMQDTIGQASALTGGYGSTYATSAGNQAYNEFIEDAYNNLPEYYQMALEAYQMEGQEMLNQLGLLNDADAREYDRMVNSFDATYQHRNQLYNEAYTQHQDSITNAYNGANLQLNEYGVQLDAAYNSAALSNDRWQQSYQNDFNEWSAKISQWQGIMDSEITSYWQRTNFDESVRQYEKDYEQTERWNQANLDYNYAQLAEEQRQFNYSIGDTNGDGVVSDEEKVAAAQTESLTNTEIKGIQSAYKNAGGGQAGFNAVTEYLNGIGKSVANETIDSYIASAEAEEGLPVWYQTWTISKDTTNWDNPFKDGNEDYNDKYTNLNGETLTFKQLKKKINNSGLSDEEKKALLKSLSSQSKK